MNQKKLFPVIHPLNCAQTFNQAENCKNAGVDGVFLINQGHTKPGHVYSNFMKLIEDTARIKQLFDLWVGVNILDKSSFFVVPLLTYYGVDGYWTDTDETWPVQMLSSCSRDISFIISYYPSFDFKYQEQQTRTDLEESLKRVRATNIYCRSNTIITTSGPATGEPPDIEKIKWFRDIIGPDCTLAIASGIDSENIESFLPYADHFLVSSSLEDKYGYFNEEKLKTMVQIIKNYNEENQ